MIFMYFHIEIKYIMKLDTKSSILLKGILAILCIHLSGIVASTILDHILKILPIKWDIHPWFRLLIVCLELWMAFLILTKERYIIYLDNSRLLRLCLITSCLFILVALKPYYTVSYMVCGNALLDGSLDGVFENMNMNKYYVSIIEYVLYGISTLCIGVYVKKNQTNGTLDRK